MKALSFKVPSPALIKRRYYFRLRLPADLLEAYAPKKEIKQALGTSDYKEALSRIMDVAKRLDQEFREKRAIIARQGKLKAARPAHAPATSASPADNSYQRPFAEVSGHELERLKALYVHEALEQSEQEDLQPDLEALKEWEERQDLMRELHKNRGLPFTPEPFPAMQGASAATLEQKRNRVMMFLQGAPMYLAERNLSFILPHVRACLERHMIAMPEDLANMRFRSFCLDIAKKEITAQKIILKLLEGDYSTTAAPAVQFVQPVAGPLPEEQQKQTPSEDNPRFMEVWKKYLAERQLKPIAEQDFAPAIRQFCELVGDLPVKSITGKHIRDFKDALLKTPTHMPDELKKKSYPEILRVIDKWIDAETEYRKLSAKTINGKKLAAVRVVLKYAADNGYIEHVPGQGIKALDTTSNGEPGRLPYTEEDLRLLFQQSALYSATPESAPGKRPQPEHDKERLKDYRWLVLMALFTGARLEELGQLDLVDVKEEKGIKYIHIHEDASTGRSVKNRSSRRKTPLHPRLLELGFMNFVEARRKAGETKLFASFRVSSYDKRTIAFARWFKRFIVELGIGGEDKKKTFHSFRHTFKREMVNTPGMDRILVDALQGHTVPGVAAQYGRDEDGQQIKLAVLFDALARCDFGGVTEGLERVMKAG